MAVGVSAASAGYLRRIAYAAIYPVSLEIICGGNGQWEEVITQLIKSVSGTLPELQKLCKGDPMKQRWLEDKKVYKTIKLLSHAILNADITPLAVQLN